MEFRFRSALRTRLTGVDLLPPQYKENKIDLDAQIAELKQQLADLS